MTLLSQTFVGEAGHPRWVIALETPYGMLLSEEYLAERIRGGEQASYDFILEIAESTLPFRNVANLLENLVNRTEWTLDNCNLKSMCEQIIAACEKAATPDGVPATMGSLGYCRYTLEDGRIVGVPGDPNADCAGRDQKYYPHTYEAILHPHMVPTLDQTFAEVADRREKRAWKWRCGYRAWDQARSDAEARRRKRDREETSKPDEGTGG